MNSTVTLKDALLAWADYRMQDIEKIDHISEIEFQKIVTDLKQERIEHLILCSTCFQKLNAQTQPTGYIELWETAWRKAAATENISWPQKLTSKNGTYQIEIRQSEANVNNGLMIVYITDKLKKKFENKTISVIDGKGRTLLKRKVKGGEVFERITNLDDIDLRLMVRPID